MGFLLVLKIVAALATIVTGLLALVRPRSIEGFTGLSAPGGRGITEFRAVFGGFFIGVGIAPILLSNQIAYTVLGAAYLATALTRLVGIFLDKSGVSSNWISLAIEIVLGIILVI